MTDDIAYEIEKLADELGVDRKRSIGEVAKELKIETSVIRFWEEKFPQIKPEIGRGSRRYYYNKQFRILKKIKNFLYNEGYTIAGLQKLLNSKKSDSVRKEADLQEIILADSNNLDDKNIEDFLSGDFEIKRDEALFGASLEVDEKKGEEENEKKNDQLKTVNYRLKLKDFANIEIPPIDPIKKKEISSICDSIRSGLEKMKKLFA